MAGGTPQDLLAGVLAIGSAFGWPGAEASAVMAANLQAHSLGTLRHTGDLLLANQGIDHVRAADVVARLTVARSIARRSTLAVRFRRRRWAVFGVEGAAA